MLKACLGLLVIGLAFSHAYQSYDNYKVVRIRPKTKDHVAAIQTLKEQTARDGIFNTLDFWREPSTLNASVDIMVHPADMIGLSRYLAKHGLPSKVVVENVQKLVDEQKALVDRAPIFKRGADPSSFPIDQYHSLAEIYDWFDSLASKYPNLVSTETIGQSFEKRDQRIIKIGAKGEKKPGFWLDAGIHAREWASVSTAVYIINELVTKYDTNPTYKELVDKIDFFILPSVNPDGYEYTRSKDRMWRKTRSGPAGPRQCYGADPNRNFDFHWGESGTSTNPCSDTYGGAKPFSEIECQNLANYLKAHSDVLKTYLTLHTYGDLFMYGYGYADHTYPADVDELKALAKDSAAAIHAVHGVTYDIGSPTDILYAAAGGSDDWAKAVAGIKWVYTLELRPGDGDPDPDQFYGFQLPEKYILPVGEETWAGLQVIAKKLIN